jgi:predicted nuclease with TOPRIM domain
LAEAEKIFSTKLSDAKRKASELEQKFNEKLTAARTELQHKLEKQSTTAVQQAVRDAEKRFERSEAEKEKDRLKFESEKTRLQDQLEKLSRKLEGQSGEELGEDGERDLVVLLRRAFQGDRIDRIGRGVKGAEARLLQLTAKA